MYITHRATLTTGLHTHLLKYAVDKTLMVVLTIFLTSVTFFLLSLLS